MAQWINPTNHPKCWTHNRYTHDLHAILSITHSRHNTRLTPLRQTDSAVLQHEPYKLRPHSTEYLYMCDDDDDDDHRFLFIFNLSLSLGVCVCLRLNCSKQQHSKWLRERRKKEEQSNKKGPIAIHHFKMPIQMYTNAVLKINKIKCYKYAFIHGSFALILGQMTRRLMLCTSRTHTKKKYIDDDDDDDASGTTKIQTKDKSLPSIDLFECDSAQRNSTNSISDFHLNNTNSRVRRN